MNAFLEASSRRQVEQLTQHLSSKYPVQSRAVGSESDLQNFVQRGLQLALTWGVDSEEGIPALLELLIQFGEKFDHSPVREWSLTIMQHPVLSGDLKVDTVWTRHHQLTQGRTFVRI